MGQAGQGKSTFVAKGIEAADQPAVWVNIDATDADPSRFLMNLTLAFQDRWATLDFKAVTNNLGTPVSPEKAPIIYHLWAQTFWENVPAEVRLVLDALEIVPKTSLTYQIIEALIHTAPESVQITLISRTRPPLKIERQKLDNKALVFDNESVAFNITETADFLRRTHQLNLNNEVIDYIHTYTEGWVVGIIFIAQWLRRKKVDHREVDLKKRLSQAVPRDIYTYIAEEVFNALSHADRQFLLQTAFLESFEPEFVGKILKIDNSTIMLKRLALAHEDRAFPFS